MYKVITPYFQHQDARGSITGIINSGKWEEINYITSVKSTVRGGHYHKETEEMFYIFNGVIQVTFEKIVNDKKSGEIETRSFKSGDSFVIYPFTLHTFEMLEDSSWINMLSKKMDEKAQDFYKA